MCYGGLDTKYITADIEARVKGVAFAIKKKEEPGQTKQGPLGLMQRLAAGLMRKDALHG